MVVIGNYSWMGYVDDCGIWKCSIIINILSGVGFLLGNERRLEEF